MTIGEFYPALSEKRMYAADLKRCIEDTIQQLLNSETAVERPGMLLGKIQCGKTRAFIGIIALAFDNGYDITVVLTKGTKALAKQTYERLSEDFLEFVDLDKVQICDIVHLPKNFTKYELQQKLIIVVKKEKNNMKRIIKALDETYPDLKDKKLLIIDDEADYASIGYRYDKDEGTVDINKITKLINELRQKVKSYDYLQVTATPYSLYLQPEEIKLGENDFVFEPVKPVFTEVLPIYEGYIGGEYYFEEEADEESHAFYLYKEVPMEELGILKKQDRRSFRAEEILTSNKVSTLRKALMNFIVGATIRRLQQIGKGERQQKYSFIVHTEQSKSSHSWQENILYEFKDQSLKVLRNDPEMLNALINDSYADLFRSTKKLSFELPTLDNVVANVHEAIENDFVSITKVNSENDTLDLLDEKGQLRLRTPLNIFIGGQILDRGLTIDNLIGFYYGRRPKRLQQDTVLQHSRMYGNRPVEDLAVTRFYTPTEIYDALKRIHEFDSALREAFEKRAHEGVVFIQKDPQNKIIPCSPNKILISSTTTLRPFKRVLPIGIQTGYRTYIRKDLEQLDQLIFGLVQRGNREEPFLLDREVAQEIIDTIDKVFDYDEGEEWDVKAFKAVLDYLSINTPNDENRGKVWCLVRTDRNLSRFKQDGSFSDAPDTPKTEGAIAKEIAIDIPILMLFRENGNEDNGWRGSPFWWPVLMAPKNTRIVVYASDVAEDTGVLANEDI